MLDFTVKSGDEPLIVLPETWLKRLNLKEGEQVTLSSLPRKSRKADPEAIEAFLALEGVFADDPDFDEAMKILEAQWAEWDRQIRESASTPDS